MKYDPIVCVVGPTASGKTRLSIALAKALNAEVVSCDSMQLYRHMTIGTAKPTPEEMDGVPHHMIDVADPDEAFSVSRYVELADGCVQDILSRGKPVVIVGGTGLYVDSLMAGRTFAPYPSTGKREELERQADQLGLEAMKAQLAQVDPDSAARLSDRRRILRALEFYQETGKTITQHNRETQALPSKYRPVWLGMTYENRADLYTRIDLRAERMLQDGLLEEIQHLLSLGIPPTATALQAIGYKEPMAALRGEITMAQALAQIQQGSRNYAKRQLTWFRRNQALHWLVQTPETSFDRIFAEALQQIPFFAP